MKKKVWVLWPDQCPECGQDVEVWTDAEQPDSPIGDAAAYDGDDWHCLDGHTGNISAEDGDAWLSWVGP